MRLGVCIWRCGAPLGRAREERYRSSADLPERLPLHASDDVVLACRG